MKATVPDSPRAGLLALIGAIRRKLRVAIATVALSWVAAYLAVDHIVALLARPLVEAWTRRSDAATLGAPALHFGALIEPFWTLLSTSFFVAVLVASPVLFFQLWRVLAPRLPADKRALGVPFATGCAVCFVGGVAFGYAFVLPAAFDFFLSYADKNLAAMHAAFGVDTASFAVRPALFLGDYLRLTIRMLLAFGVAFELPVLITLLAWLGVVGHRALWRFNRWAVVLAFLLAAFLTPGPDVLSQLMLALPLVALYNVSIALAWLIARRRGA